jgi:hypothetical protein
MGVTFYTLFFANSILASLIPFKSIHRTEYEHPEIYESLYAPDEWDRKRGRDALSHPDHFLHVQPGFDGRQPIEELDITWIGA